MKKYIFTILWFLLLSLLGCTNNTQTNINENNIEKITEKIKDTKEIINQQEIQNIANNIEIEENINNWNSTLNWNQLTQLWDKKYWKIFIFGGTYCSHCQKSIPIFKSDIYDKYQNNFEIFINVVDGHDWKRFDIEWLNQWYEPNITFEWKAQKECNYIPSWVVLDMEDNPIISSCWNEKTLEDMEKSLIYLINN